MKRLILILILVLTFATTSYAQVIHAFFLCNMKKNDIGELVPDLPAPVEFWQVWGKDPGTKMSIVYVLIRNHRKVTKCSEVEEGATTDNCTYADDKNTALLLKSSNCISHATSLREALQKFYAGTSSALAKKVTMVTIDNPDYNPELVDSPKTLDITTEEAETITAKEIGFDVVKPKAKLLGCHYGGK